MKYIGLLFLAVLLLHTCTRQSGGGLPERISYNFHVRPILSDKCFVCHGPDENQRQAGLRLDVAEAALAPLKDRPDEFAIVPGRPDRSELIRRVESQDPEIQMPTPESHLGALNEREILILKKWIEQGAGYEKHWAFLAPRKTPLPRVTDKKWPRNELDYFSAAKMQEHDLQPNPEAEPAYLLKRLHMDLTGLPPTLSDMQAFEADASGSAYEKAVDHLLASSAFGEKMAVLWLDVARYSDSYGYQDDNLRTQWPYRDWVIHAFNQNIPYDQFIVQQLAGDLLDSTDKAAVLATAFLRNHKYTEEGGVIPEEYRVEYMVDKVKTYSKGLLALTVECAQCHDHKYDPFSQKDYYRLMAFFNSSKEEGFEGDVSVSRPAKKPVLLLTDAEIRSKYPFIHKKDTGTVMVSVMEERDTARPSFVLQRGAYDKPGEPVQASALEAVLPFDTSALPRNRLGLARWTVSRDNPLTARVWVNLLWQEFFGAGLVKTSGDFGMQGNLPTHPELLDWLSVDFMENGWDTKRLVRQIVLSATYRQSARVTEQHLQKDPENNWLARAPRLRYKAEFVRDFVLASSGLLNREIGGPSVKPYQPAGLWENASSGRGVLKTYVQDTDSQLYRRGLYTFVKLTLPPPAMIMFDASNRDQCEVKRTRTNTPLQALIMMNDPTVLEASRVLAQRLLAQNPEGREMIETAFRSILCRRPAEKEKSILEAYYAEQLEAFQQKKLDAAKTLRAGQAPLDKSLDLNAVAAMMKVVSTLYNMEEAVVKT
ncbi:MAG: PSD1 and planctomycete cytochrome C domain-containing protein [Saprospiraceae bacterium]|nr:PSD1 and planctomycete cytochrome C domain-containing protein [Saprospiraceae bacterium]